MYLPASEVHSESSQTSKLKLFMKIIKEWKPLTTFKKSFIIDVWLGSECNCVIYASMWYVCMKTVFRGILIIFFLYENIRERGFFYCSCGFLLHSKNISPRVFSWDFYKISRTVFFGIHQSSKILLHWTLENAKQKLKKS